MSQDDLLRRSFAAIEVNDDFTQATVRLTDGSGMVFCHRVGERWARSLAAEAPQPALLAEQVLVVVARFRLNGKHLDVQFADGSRWEVRFR